MECRGSAGWLKKGCRDLGRACPSRKVAGDHGDAARQLRGEEGGADGLARLAARGKGDAGLGAGRAGRARAGADVLGPVAGSTRGLGRGASARAERAERRACCWAEEERGRVRERAELGGSRAAVRGRKEWAAPE